ncbi:MAG TPA: ABC transporter permease [Pyrinomonadaceae bacterium]
MTTLIQDLRYGLQMLWKHPGFTAVAVLTLALGVGANTALFSVVDALLLKQLPVKDPDRLVLLRATWHGDKFSPGSYNGSNQGDPNTGLINGTSFPFQTFDRLRQERATLSDVIAFSGIDLNLNSAGNAERVNGQVVSGNYFYTLGVPPLEGRLINDADDNTASTPVAVISYRYWITRFGGDKGIVGKQVNLNSLPFTIVGVTPSGFEGTGQVGSTQDVSIPLAWEPQVAGEQTNFRGAGVWFLRLMGRLQPGATREQAQASLASAFQQSVAEHRATRQSRSKTALRALEPKDFPQLVVDPGAQGEMNMRRYYEKPLRLLIGVVVLVLLIACANVANLLLVRASARRKEIAIRLAVGASRWRLIRQLLTESVLLAIIGGSVGILFASWIKNGLLAVADWTGQGLVGLTPRIDWRVLAFTLGICVLTGLLFGLAPAIRSSQVELTPTLKEAGRTSGAIGRSWLTKSLVVVQVAISVLLLIGAGLLIRTLRNLQHVDIGFNSQNLLIFSIEPGLIGYKGDKLSTLYQNLFSRIEAIPGVQAATASQHPLLSLSATTTSVFLPGGAIGADGRRVSAGDVKMLNVRQNFLEAMQIPLLMGRSLTPQDGPRAPKVSVVNQTFARKYFPNENVIGKRFNFDDEDPSGIEIVGLAQDAKYTSQRDEIEPTAYFPYDQSGHPLTWGTIEVRTQGDPTAYVSAVREAVREVDSNLPINNVKTQVQQATEILSLERLFAKLLSLFGVLAQSLAAVGLYGVMAYSVSQRTHEIGVRMALGATRRTVLEMILKQGMILTVIGIVVGLAGAYALIGYLDSLTSMLFGVKPRDPMTFVVIAALLAVIALLACFIPARRATKVDPLVALRYE